ncbi:hypothetical protein [Turneriella parva]|uniref:Uncharacterized protein n=1 Tax=Turneriella parva (strain ATCC BAA-1111 / DSM 21527 / NCTC 11395 / H) TaxID=869212 RepID=I4BB88_TURPD|nr:hypothetical protein [Turneriella parva]AFM14545.1 hypothetical protein Turpa_3911 [Turneriella parva DSM 21527]
MKPLDLNVGIQNSYEAARSEAVRLDKPQVLNQLQNQDSAKEQLARDQRVSAPEGTMLHQDLFAEDAYEPPDYDLSDSQKRQKRKQQQQSVRPGNASEASDEPAAAAAGEAEQGGFSTYA